MEKLQRNLSQVEAWKSGKLKNDEVKARLEAAYHIRYKGLEVVAEELKQRLVAEAAKLQRYNTRSTQYRQNQQFQHDQKRLYAQLQGESRMKRPILKSVSNSGQHFEAKESTTVRAPSGLKS